MMGLYIHIPFCVSKCAYCDFYSLPGKLELIDSYIEAVIQESSKYAGMSFQTLYLGGGTPSLLGGDSLRKLMRSLHNILDLSRLQEATIEVNPESATLELLEAALESGINRISIGIQSLSDKELKSAGRIHNASRALKAFRLARETGFTKISADLIIGLPGQEWETLKTSVETLIGMGVEHLSLYCLSIEEGTSLAMNLPDNLPSDDTQAELYSRASLLLREYGFIHYEISNFARAGKQCLHNLNYWRCGEYVGLGAAAASHLQRKRFRNRSDLYAYLEDPTGLVEDVEQLGDRDKAAEEAMLRLRLLDEGLNIDELAERYGSENTSGLCARLDKMVEEESIIRNGTVYRLDPSRVLTSNPVLAAVLE